MTEKKDPCVWDGDPILIEYKDEKTKYDFYLASTSGWANPWDHRLKNKGFEVSSPEEAAENFKKCLWGEKFTDTLQLRRKWLLINIKYLKGKKIAYDYKPYADILVEAIDKDISIPNIDVYKKPEKIEKPKKKNIF